MPLPPSNSEGTSAAEVRLGDLPPPPSCPRLPLAMPKSWSLLLQALLQIRVAVWAGPRAGARERARVRARVMEGAWSLWPTVTVTVRVTATV
jgi:hypothetical protein